MRLQSTLDASRNLLRFHQSRSPALVESPPSWGRGSPANRGLPTPFRRLGLERRLHWTLAMQRTVMLAILSAALATAGCGRKKNDVVGNAEAAAPPAPAQAPIPKPNVAQQ